ncbi:MAG: hypothetical protein EB060_11900, partial [Proteobacteria bacterium]|nr:hypothetical protein [Pseudomonadota bacterium]
RISEYVCLEHQGYARTKAIAWWTKRSDKPAPVMIDQAIQEAKTIRTASQILVSFASKYPEIKRYDFDRSMSA